MKILKIGTFCIKKFENFMENGEFAPQEQILHFASSFQRFLCKKYTFLGFSEC